jgi:hypothetical protein
MREESMKYEFLRSQPLGAPGVMSSSLKAESLLLRPLQKIRKRDFICATADEVGTEKVKPFQPRNLHNKLRAIK